MTDAIYEIAKVATPALLTLLVIVGTFCAKALFKIYQENHALRVAVVKLSGDLKEWVLQLYNEHDQQLAKLEYMNNETQIRVKDHSAKLETHDRQIIMLESHFNKGNKS